MSIKLLKASCLAIATVCLSMAAPKPFFMDDTELNGAGSSFDYPLFTKMFADYNTATGIKVNYQSVGSGAGISQLTAKTVDFGATDAPMNGKQDSALSAPAIHIPVTAGAVVLSYNLPDVKGALLLTPSVLADIFLGNITMWNDGKIAAFSLNIDMPGAATDAPKRVAIGKAMLAKLGVL